MRDRYFVIPALASTSLISAVSKSLLFEARRALGFLLQSSVISLSNRRFIVLLSKPFIGLIATLCLSPLAAAGQTRAANAAKISKPTGAVTALAFSPNGKTLAVGRYRSVLLLDVSSRRTLKTLSGMEGAVTSLAFSKAGDLLAAGSGTRAKTEKLYCGSRRPESVSGRLPRTTI